VAAARWQSGVSVGSAAEAAWQRRGNGNVGGSVAEAAAAHGSAAAVAAAWRRWYQRGRSVEEVSSAATASAVQC
jgi:hypothetical protein